MISAFLADEVGSGDRKVEEEREEANWQTPQARSHMMPQVQSGLCFRVFHVTLPYQSPKPDPTLLTLLLRKAPGFGPIGAHPRSTPQRHPAHRALITEGQHYIHGASLEDIGEPCPQHSCARVTDRSLPRQTWGACTRSSTSPTRHLP